MFTIAYRLCLNSLRRKHALSGEIDFSNIASGATDASEEIAESEEAARLRAAIWEAVDRLSVPQRATVLLFYREEMSCQAVAQVLGMPVATVKSHLHRARARLEEILEPSVASDWTRLRLVSEAG